MDVGFHVSLHPVEHGIGAFPAYVRPAGHISPAPHGNGQLSIIIMLGIRVQLFVREKHVSGQPAAHKLTGSDVTLHCFEQLWQPKRRIYRMTCLDQFEGEDPNVEYRRKWTGCVQ